MEGVPNYNPAKPLLHGMARSKEFAEGAKKAKGRMLGIRLFYEKNGTAGGYFVMAFLGSVPVSPYYPQQPFSDVDFHPLVNTNGHFAENKEALQRLLDNEVGENSIFADKARYSLIIVNKEIGRIPDSQRTIDALFK